MKVIDGTFTEGEYKILSEETHRLIIKTNSGLFILLESFITDAFEITCDGVMVIKPVAANQITLKSTEF